MTPDVSVIIGAYNRFREWTLTLLNETGARNLLVIMPLSISSALLRIDKLRGVGIDWRFKTQLGFQGRPA